MVVDVSAYLLAAHHDMGSAVGFPEGYSYLRDGSLSVRIEKFGSIGNDGSVFLLGSAKEARYVHEGDNRNVEGIAEAYESGSLPGCVDVENAGDDLRLVGHDADTSAVHVCEANYDVAGVALVNLEEFPVIDNALYDIVHVVGLVRAVRDDVIEAVIHP